MENEKYPYQKEWEVYKKRQKAFWLVFLGYVPLMILFSAVFGNLYKSVPIIGEIGYLLFIIFGIACLICGIILQYWKCPRCLKSFHTTWWWSNILSGKCLHCKLPKYEGSTFYFGRMGDFNR